MAYDPVHQSQLYLRRAGKLLRSHRVRALPEVDHRRRHLEGTDRDRLFDTGYKQVGRLASEIEAYTGCTLEGRRALDFGCGMGRLAIPMAERCAHVYGLEISPELLQEADRNAQRMNVTNVDWLEADRLAELSGRYDLAISVFVFQHIPTREGERIFAMILEGLRPGGVGAIHVTLRPAYSLKRFLRGNNGAGARSFSPMSLIRRLDWSYAYMLANSYSLNRLGVLLADAGVTKWQVNTSFAPASTRRSYEAVTIFFRKDGESPAT
jgi:2-polyprenyl-3-methyl-5-hydroxy-6-metoxy-1,4-benzoquinol methylase